MSYSTCIKCESIVPMYEKYCIKCLDIYKVKQDKTFHKRSDSWRKDKNEEFENDLKKVIK